MSALDSYRRYLGLDGIPEHDPLVWNLGDYIQHWSPSSLSKARKCPYQWQQSYIHKRSERPSESLTVGSAIHAGLERNFEQKIESHSDLSVLDLLDWYDDEGWDTTVSIKQNEGGDDVLWKTSPEMAKQRGKNLLGSYHVEVAPRIQPTGAEGMVSADFGLAVPVIGRYDVLREESCIDFKTGMRAHKKPDEGWRIQAAVYTEATGMPVEFHSITATEKGKPTIYTPLEAPDLLVAPTPLERRRMVTTLRAISAEMCMYMSIYGPDDPWPQHGRFHQWACDFCGYRADCPAWEEGA